MVLTFTENAFGKIIFTGKKMVKKINELIKVIERTPFEGIGKPEPLKYDLAGYWSRRVDREHRLVYQIINDELLIYACRYHYDS